MPLLTFGDLKRSSIPRVVGVCPDDEKFVQWANESQQRMLNRGRWWGTVKEALFCVTNGCLTMPREVATIEAVTVCGKPIPVTNDWYSYIVDLTCRASCDSCRTGRGFCGHLKARPHFTAPTFADVLGTDQVIRTYLTNAADAGKKIIYQGYDKNGIWIRSQIDGIQQDGEQVVLADPFVDTVSTFDGGMTGVLKGDTKDRVLVYSHGTVTNTDRAIAIYQSNESRPDYRRIFIPGLSGVNCRRNCNCSEVVTACETKTVTAIVSLQHVPVVNDNDRMVIGNLAAFKEAIQSLKYEEDGNMILASLHFNGGRDPKTNVPLTGAIGELNSELRKMNGDISSVYVNLQGPARLDRQFAGFW